MSGTEKNPILCPNCRKLISSEEASCPYCGITRPGSRLKRSFFKKPQDVIKVIIYCNIAIFIFSLILTPLNLGSPANPLTFLSPSNNSLLLLGATGTIPIDRFGRWWTLLSASFIHGGILHIFFNMFALRQLGPFVLQEYGFNRFAIIYLLSGILGFYMSYLAGVFLTIGASASICGLIGAILYYGKSRGGLYGEAIYRQAMGWIIGLVLFGLMVPGINNWAHGGGIVAGMLIGLILGYNERKSENFFHRIVASGFILLTVIVLLFAIVQAIYYRFIV
ncbi:MAG: rhomboid family intramembrane serine protease [Syntrophales bacterium]|nr:rhomboid family intramembrane serine protease [Syntrophales bacterium]